MVPPLYSPILLFPCGHTFCKTCVYTTKGHSSEKVLSISKCPVCRQRVQSAALNISLQNLICAYTNNQHLIKAEENKPLDIHHHTQDDSKRRELCNLRIDIMSKEAEEIKMSNKALDKKVKENKEVVSHLQGREEEVT